MGHASPKKRQAGPCRCTRCGPVQCFARASAACAKADGLNASACSWHHISRTEHVCSECVQHYKQSTEWQSRADAPADDEASRLLEHIVSAHLPYWVRCECGVWRPLPQHADASQLRERHACCVEGGCTEPSGAASADKFDDSPLVDLEVWGGDVRGRSSNPPRRAFFTSSRWCTPPPPPPSPW